ncbi:MFS transporter [Planomonospora parontospora subsp. parontospora]|uniref:MFS transporter n=2 Tax=Planomonospora parontospora TaxID=58119 RepID=A0AA37F3I9_9ACTN|nr:MFS transporter [Planomonospora parontospora]GGK58284.1 MFS transporter [Planomonospora parontospora]GII07880.1 MFS transporter [Planomonospora parontospora subsp. parontospora]
MKTESGVPERWTVLAVCCLSLFLVGLDTTAVNVGLPSIGAGLQVGTRGLEWVVDAYTLVLAGLLISSGALADRIGRRRVFRLGLAVFGAASAACALAPTVGVLVAARAVQGVGGSMLSPVALAIVVNAITEPRERARAIGVWAAVFGASMAAGPVVGGALVSEFGWRSVFWINVPIVALALALTAVFVPESRAERPRRFDGPGQLLLTVVVGGAVAVLIEGPHIGWDSPAAVAGCVVTAVAAAAFVRIESRRAEPLVDPRLFRRPPFTAAVVGAVTVFVALSATLLLTTLYLQDARGMTPLAAGVVTLPMAVAATVCAPLSGLLTGRFGARPPLLLAGGFITAGGLCLVGTGDHTDVRSLSLACLLVGVGFGFANAPITNTAVSGLPSARAGVAGGITSTARQLGSALGIAVAGGVIANAPPAHLAQAARPGWLLVAGCGLVVLAVAMAAPAAGARRRPEAGAEPDGDGEAAHARADAGPDQKTRAARIRTGADPGRG